MKILLAARIFSRYQTVDEDLFSHHVCYVVRFPFSETELPSYHLWDTVYAIEKAAKLNAKRWTAKIRLQTVLWPWPIKWLFHTAIVMQFQATTTNSVTTWTQNFSSCPPTGGQKKVITRNSSQPLIIKAIVSFWMDKWGITRFTKIKQFSKN